MRRSGVSALLFIVVLAAALLTMTFVNDNSPQLGLDLQGGASVVLEPSEGSEASREALSQSISIIRNRVDALGVAEPEITRQGNAIVVELPGVKDQRRALEVVGRTAELRFRPVLAAVPPQLAPQLSATSSTLPTSPDPSVSTSVVPVDTTVTSDTTPTSEQGLGLVDGEWAGGPLQDPTTSSSTDTTATTATTPTDSTPTTAASTTASTVPVDPTQPCGEGQTAAEDDEPTATVLVPGQDGDDDGVADICYQLGPVPADEDGNLLTGSAVRTARASIPGNEWIVELEFRGNRIALFNQVAQECFNQGPTCPTRQVAIVLDSVVESAPQIQPDQGAFTPFSADEIQISGGQASEGDGAGGFSEREAKDLALVLRYGALPVQLEPQTVQTISATLGEDSLNAGLAAGLVGVGLVALYILVYYRALGVVVLLGLAVWAALNFSIIAWLGENRGLALSLSGVTGIIVSVGVTVDSYVVYFERLKDEIRSGKTIRSSVDRGFKRAFQTILAADIASFIGAALLYWLTVGAVRGFAFFLGLSTLLDIVVAWFFTRPMVALLGRSRFFTEARWVGVARGLGAARATT